jgi:rhodanese-related sulfurtransferase
MKQNLKTTTVIATLILLFCSEIAGQVDDSVKFKSLEPYDFHLTYLRTDTAMLVDVREFFEYKRTRIKDAVNIPISSNLEKAADTLDKNCALFLYCTTDYRSIRVARKLYDLGFRQLYNLEGGIVLWRRDGFPVEKKRLRRR